MGVTRTSVRMIHEGVSRVSMTITNDYYVCLEEVTDYVYSTQEAYYTTHEDSYQTVHEDEDSDEQDGPELRRTDIAL